MRSNLKNGTQHDHEVVIQFQALQCSRTLTSLIQQKYFQRSRDYYFVWAQQDILFKVAGKGQMGENSESML